MGRISSLSKRLNDSRGGLALVAARPGLKE